MATIILNIKTEKLPERKLAYIANTGPYKGNTELFGKLFTKVAEWGKPKGLFNNPNTEAITVYHDDPEFVPEDQLTISVGFTVQEETDPDKEIQIMELPEGLYVVGSFEIFPTEYETAWNQTFEYIKSEKLKPSGMMYESYKNEPNTHPEGKHIVDICIAIEE